MRCVHSAIDNALPSWPTFSSTKRRIYFHFISFAIRTKKRTDKRDTRRLSSTLSIHGNISEPIWRDATKLNRHASELHCSRRRLSAPRKYVSEWVEKSVETKLNSGLLRATKAKEKFKAMHVGDDRINRFPRDVHSIENEICAQHVAMWGRSEVFRVDMFARGVDINCNITGESYHW